MTVYTPACIGPHRFRVDRIDMDAARVIHSPGYTRVIYAGTWYNAAALFRTEAAARAWIAKDTAGYYHDAVSVDDILKYWPGTN